MNQNPLSIALTALALSAVWGCGPKTAAPAPTPAEPPSPPKTAAPPAKMATMICRNSQDGRSVACGTPNAVMVGIKED